MRKPAGAIAKASNSEAASRSLRANLPDFSARGRARVVAVTVVGTVGCVAAALFVDSFTFLAEDAAARDHAILVDVLLPIALAAPLLAFLMSKLRELAIAHYDLSIIASTDSLTAVLNKGAFRMLVDAYLSKVAEQNDPCQGALLVVDVDHFKTINDRFGHEQGDTALQLVARSIQSALRGADIVGRIGGEEFGVFLVASSAVEAGSVAERIRGAIRGAEFRPRGNRNEPLSVSVGGREFSQRGYVRRALPSGRPTPLRRETAWSQSRRHGRD